MAKKVKRLRKENALLIIYYVMQLVNDMTGDAAQHFKELVEKSMNGDELCGSTFISECPRIDIGSKRKKEVIMKEIENVLVEENYYRIGKNPQTGKIVISENKKEKCMNTNILIWNIMVILSEQKKSKHMYDVALMVAKALDHEEEYLEMNAILLDVLECKKKIAKITSELKGNNSNAISGEDNAASDDLGKKNEEKINEIESYEQKMKALQLDLSNYFAD